MTCESVENAFWGEAADVSKEFVLIKVAIYKKKFRNQNIIAKKFWDKAYTFCPNYFFRPFTFSEFNIGMLFEKIRA